MKEGRLTGKELLNKVGKLGELSKSEKAIACGYVSPGGRALTSQFSDALIAAMGIDLEATAPTTVKRRRVSSVRAAVQKSGAIAIGATHVRKLGLNPGDKYVVEIGSRAIHITPQRSQEEVQEPESVVEASAIVVDAEFNGAKIPAAIAS